jgi:DNA polymerase-3 subunit alpha
VIGDRPLVDLVALYRDPKSDIPASQFNMKWAENAGLVKFDFLGLKTLTVIDRALKFIAEGKGNDGCIWRGFSGCQDYELMASGHAGRVPARRSGHARHAEEGAPASIEDVIVLSSRSIVPARWTTFRCIRRKERSGET